MNGKKLYAGRLAYLLSMALVVIFATSCNDDDDGYNLDTYWFEMATVEAPGQTDSFNIVQTSFSLLTDHDESLYPSLISYYISGYTTKNQQRTLIEYNLLSGERNGYDHYIRLVDLVNVLTKSVDTVTVDTDASSVLLGADPIRMNSVWVSGNYVNIVFSYRGSFNTTHYINLVDNEVETPENPSEGLYKLHFAHDAKDDTGTTWFKGIVSFKLPEGLVDVTQIQIACDNFGTPQTATRDYGASDVAPKIKDLDNPAVQ